MRRRTFAQSLLLVLAGCYGGEGSVDDTGASLDSDATHPADTSTRDSARPDSEESDSPDTSLDTSTETGAAETGGTETGGEDSGFMDTGTSSEPTAADADAVILGEAGDYEIGRVTTPAGDVDGDGLMDLWVGKDNGDPRAIFQFRGPLSSTSTSADAAVRVLSSTGELFPRYEPVMAHAGDVDADGYSDLIFGDAVHGDADEGIVMLLQGPGAGDVYLEEADAFIWGEEEESGTGDSLAGPGDINGDGWDDLLIGSPGATAAGASSGEGACPGSEEDEPGEAEGAQAGVTWLFYGPVTGSHGVSGADASLTGEDGYDRSGSSVQGGGDLDGDGLPDLLISASNQCALVEGGGAGYVVLSPVSDSVSLADADGKLLAPVFQSGIRSVGDVDGDGIPDLRWRTSDTTISDASMFLFSGPALGEILLSDAVAEVQKRSSSDAVSSVMNPIGDLDADGFADLLFVDSGDDTTGRSAGAAYILRGPISGVHDLSESDLKITGPAAGDVLGWDGAGLGDTNGDGLPDIVLGAPGHDTAGAEAGAAYLLLGGGSILGAL